MIGRVRVRASWVLVGAILAAAVTPARAQSVEPPPASLTLEAALGLLNDRSPRTRADRATVAVAEADRITARTLPNPTVSYGTVHLLHGLSTGATTEHEAAVEQPLLLFHQRQTRMDAVNANVRAEGARVNESLASRRFALRQTFVSLLARQRQLEVAREGLANLERVQQLVRGRAAAGDRSQYEVLRIETETEAFRVQVANVQADVTDLSRQVASILGIPGWTPRAVGTLEAGKVPSDVETLWTMARAKRPSLVARRAEEGAARQGLLLAERERRPIPSITGGTQTTQNVHGTSMMLGVAVPLPFFDRNQGPIARAAAEASAASLQVRAGEAEARAEIERAAAVLAGRTAAWRLFQQSVGARLPRLQQMAETAYREGTADILELLDVTRSLRDYQSADIEQLEAVALAEEAVVAAAGLDADTAPSAPEETTR